MGARAQVLVQDGEDKVYLYTHYGAECIADDVRDALNSSAGQERYSDFEYLARIIFEVMIGDERGGATGFGIGVAEHGDIEVLVTVDVANSTVEVEDKYVPKNNRVKSMVEFCDEK